MENVCSTTAFDLISSVQQCKYNIPQKITEKIKIVKGVL